MDEGNIQATVAGMPCRFLIDSGAQVNTFTEALFRRMISDPNYSVHVFNIQEKSDRTLKAYATIGEIEVLATFEANLFISNDRPVYLEKFYVVRELRSLLGRPTATRYSVLMLGVKVPVSSDQNPTISFLTGEIALVNAKNVFPKFNIPPVKISYNKSVPPCRNVYLSIPQSVRPLVEERLQQLVSADIIERVTDDMDTSFCSSMIVVPKGKHDIRLVIDLRGPNQYIYRTPFSMPTLESIVADLNGAHWFSTIDLSNAYFHVELDTESRHLTNFFTEFGMFRCVRLPFGLCNAPDIFQEILQRKILGGCKGVKNYQDDVLVFGGTKDEHDTNLAIVMARLKEHNVKLNESKCVFGSQKVDFLGFVLTPKGWEIDEEKMAAIKSFRRPQNCGEVKSFLGLVTFIDRFLLKRADITVNLRALANSDVFHWTEREEKEFRFLQEGALNVIKTLGYYSTTDEIELYVDASPIGLGAVLVQFNGTGIPRVIACASKSLTCTEKKYPQAHKESLAVVWGVERFASYLLSRHFTVRTDAEANEFIFGTNHRIGRRALARADAWALRLQPFDFDIKRIPGESNVADALSRLINGSQEAIPFEEENGNHFLFALDTGSLDLTWEEIENASETDAENQLLRTAIELDQWPPELRKFEAQKKYLHSLGFLIFKDNRIILPEALRQRAMQTAHGGHIGEVTMKRIMREYFWWPRMSSEVECFVKKCETCIRLSRKNPPVPLSSRELPDGPWQILQVDFLSIPGFGSGEFLVIVDTFSRYISVVEMRHMDAESTNAALCEVFQLWGCPLILQSDNGPPFQSTHFIKFWEDKGIRVRKSIPLSPQSNGAVERQNQGLTKALAASKIEGTNWRRALQLYVHNHNNIVPHSRLLVTPFELMCGWKFRGHFPCLWEHSRKLVDHTDVRERDAETKLISKKDADSARGAKQSDIKIGDTVLLAQSRKTKTDPIFSSERYKVIARDGPKVVVVSKNGIQYARNVQDVKMAPTVSVENTSDINTEVSASDSTENLSRTKHNNPEYSYLSIDEANPSTSVDVGGCKPSEFKELRRRDIIKRPSRYDEKFVYTVFQ
ncbi:uncharacterized protein K02A2.6-like [Armigeres subalbatus]|uniref:uncharacterized protein K02A2.6-like n=1 Tax=Armigeres subalbatus TaxID=124917 RepID=UPI002ED17FD3